MSLEEKLQAIRADYERRVKLLPALEELAQKCLDELGTQEGKYTNVNELIHYFGQLEIRVLRGADSETIAEYRKIKAYFDVELPE